jgi:tRNA threonylcarbamoyladenosine biosynthesis protein TsaE
MDSAEWLLEDLAATALFGEKLGRLLSPGDFIGLRGELGAGKTALVRTVARGAGVAEGTVTSPTFAILNSYQGRSLVLHHADLYRLQTRDELYATGYFEVMEDGAMLVEWIDRIPRAVPEDWLEITLTIEGENRRRLVARSHGSRATRLLQGLSGSQPSPARR